MQNPVSIAHVPRRVAAATGAPAPSPRTIYSLTLREAFPAQFVGGRWFVEADDIPKVAEALGLSVRTAPEMVPA